MNNKQIQTLLNVWLKSQKKTLLVVDGKIGPLTRQASKDFQKAHGLVVDGKPGPITQYELMFFKYSNFRKSEFKCKCGGKYCNGYPVKVDENLLILLQKIRYHFGKPVNINSAIRCKQHNRNIGSTDTSQHVRGAAADIRISSISPSTVYNYCNSINPSGGVGKYSTFTHIDTRNKRARW
ncbi:DUF882 domain-containing protein [Alkalibaculum sp. M08DMB]|uniref:DUF882 domain-containing protein n=1 Tax=Alkalibaculum sporogenes TaxID=2655001 RepID=A0A6A7KAJ9_9FIRM|nr:D-Ala-D-Ala carboxypeptidase family metallohydrolase [Alkalibaculum sporogenes]MPW26392.1 DUF882 domain-containing protein [Alkalibaculum sporogenes]